MPRINAPGRRVVQKRPVLTARESPGEPQANIKLVPCRLELAHFYPTSRPPDALFLEPLLHWLAHLRGRLPNAWPVPVCWWLTP